MKRRKVLVVDSDENAAQLLRLRLEGLGYDTLAAHSGEAALRVVQGGHPDVVVLELALPDRDGLDVLRAIRRDAGLCGLPVIILSARATDSDKLLGLDAGADDYVTKPFNLRELGARIGALCRRRYHEFAAGASGTPCEHEERDRTMRLNTAAENKSVVQIEEMTKVYQMGEVQVHALRGISLTVRAGEYVAVMGASGSGKSTLMNMIGLLDRPTSGSYRIRGEETSRLGKSKLADLRNHEIGFVFQRFNLLPRISARRQLELPLLYAGIARRKGQEMAADALALVGLTDRASHCPEELSGGQQQRVAIARALVNRPSLLLADEPTGALDSQTGAEVLDLVDTLQSQGLTIIMVTHDYNVAKRAERVIVLSDGKVTSDEKNGKNLAKRILGVGDESH